MHTRHGEKPGPRTPAHLTPIFLGFHKAAGGTLNTRQKYLFAEAVSNLETGAYRSAVVMGWNLAYDIIRQWIFDDATHREAFNTELEKIVDKSGKPKFDPVSNYPDFYDLGEKIVLDVCKGANLIGGNLYDDLRSYLRQRNAYAHASDSHPTVNQVSRTDRSLG